MSQNNDLMDAADCLKKGGVLVYPTEAMFGIGCLATDQLATRRVRKLKSRPDSHGLIVVVASPEQILPWLSCSESLLAQYQQRFWPGHTTLLLPISPQAPRWITGSEKTIAVRVSAHPGVMALCEAVSAPLVSTSANPKAKPAATTLATAKSYFGGACDYYLDGTVDSARQASTIIDPSTGATLR